MPAAGAPTASPHPRSAWSDTPAAPGAASRSAALPHIRICDLSGQLAGAGSTRTLAAFGAQVIRIEDPTTQGRWDILRGSAPTVDERKGINLGGAFNNHNVEKLGITLNLRTDEGKALLTRLIEISDVVTENFSSGVMERLGFSYERMRAINERVIYVSNSGFGKTGPYGHFKTFGPIVQACCGLTFSSGLVDQPPAGWGFSYMDHMGANVMALAVLAALVARNRTGQGQWIDMSCTEAGLALTGPELLDYTVNDRPLRRPGMPDSNTRNFPEMTPHGIYPASGDDSWVAIACRDDADWGRLAGVIDEGWARDPALAEVTGRQAGRTQLEEHLANWTRQRSRGDTEALLRAAGVPAARVASPQERIDSDPTTADWGLWPTVHHTEIGDVRVDGVPVHLSETDWVIERGAPCLGEHNDLVLGSLLGLSDAEIDELRRTGVI
jgi:crotonobetainyl-CoA:carnitine CoA-transferase CaiB-like acyl-CoA transferase